MSKTTGVSKTAPVIELNAGEQQDILNKLGRLTKKSLNVISKAVIATKVCGFCLDNKPRRKNLAGNCASCNGLGVVDDFERNKWGAEQILGRKLPMPKSIEMKLEDKRDKEELIKAFKGIHRADAEKMLAEMDRQLKNNMSRDVSILEVSDADEDED